MTHIQTEHTGQSAYESAPEKGEAIHYPYPSIDAKNVKIVRDSGAEIDEWIASGVDLDEVIRSIGGPVIEVGGPTETGFYFLEGKELPARPVMTNRNTEDYHGQPMDEVELVFDARSIPFPDDSLGIVLSAHLPKVDIHAPLLDLLSDAQRTLSLDYMLAEADGATKRVAREKVIDEEALNTSLRLGIANEVFKKLKPGGLYLTDGEPWEVQAIEVLGYEIIAKFNEGSLVHVTGDDEEYYSLVFRKP